MPLQFETVASQYRGNRSPTGPPTLFKYILTPFENKLEPVNFFWNLCGNTGYSFDISFSIL